MPIRIKTPDGGFANFPDGTDDATIEAALSEAFPPQRQFGGLEAFGRGALQGASLGFSDEIGGGINRLAPGLGLGTQEEISAANEQARSQRPGTFLAGELSSALLPGGPAARVAGLGVKGLTKAAPEAGRLAQGAAAGGAVGGTFGAGASEGDPTTLEGLQSRATGAGVGLGLGAGLGAATVPAVEAGGAVVRGIKNRFTPQATRGENKLSEAILRDRVRSGEFSDKEAGGVLGAISRRLGEARAQDSPAILADFGGKNVQKLLRSASNQASQGAQKLAETLERRQLFQNERITREIGKALGDPKKFDETAQGLIEARKLIANQEFSKAFAIETPLTPGLQEVLNRPVMQRVLKRASDRMLNEGRQLQGSSSTEVLHLAKMEIDAMLNQVQKQIGKKSIAGVDMRTLAKLKGDLVGNINNPAYKNALNKFSGDKALENALEEGIDDAFKLNPAELAKKMEGLNASEREMFQLGAVRGITNKMAEVPRNNDRIKRFLSSPAVDDRLRALIPDNKARRQLQLAIQREKRFVRTRQAVQGNSTTAEQLAAGGEAGRGVGALEAAEIGKKTLTGDIGGLLFNVAKGASNKFTGFTPKTANSVIEAALSSGDELAPSLARALARADKSPARRKAIADALTRGGSIGGTQGLTGGIGPRFDEFGNLKPGQKR